MSEREREKKRKVYKEDNGIKRQGKLCPLENSKFFITMINKYNRLLF